ncbi:hypothetical protein QFC21_006161 [Naganishia friedmannii]|uniref:Uncharacterized protein n=1 Tax=Naganishia friedmannii TaxID=89922 RepID=A0ACC2V3Y0_9TREE|nr:hypothetical protein QFC21_006161 [Naganishia friedmannii]
MKTTIQAVIAVTGFATVVSAFPFMAEAGAAEHYLRHARSLQGSGAPDVEVKRALGFDASLQKVDVSGSHAFNAPGSGDKRGPCPGLNALANHGYLPHNGITTLAQAVEATNSVYGMGVDLGTFLSAYATLIDGDPASLTWSIGGEQSTLLGLTGLFSKPQGLSGSHNKYESDSSPTRGDYYTHNGASWLQLDMFQHLYGMQAGDSGGNYDLGVLTEQARWSIQKSRAENPNFFWGPFSGIIVSHPEGVLDQNVLKSFFAVSGTQGKLSYQQGYERIPENWYRRPIGIDYTIPGYSADNTLIQLQVPERLAVGGNMGTVNSFAGVDLSDLTGGVYNSQSLAQGNNALCFAYTSLLTLTPDILKGVLKDVTGAVNQIVGQFITPQFASLNCPSVQYYNKDVFKKYPGATGAY